MTAPLIRGWCPGARRPMMAGDGLVLRVRPPLGELTPAQATGLADLAQLHGNGLIELTSRANLQLRGLSDDSHAPLIEALAELDLLDADAEVEARRNIVLDPFRPVGPDVQNRIAAGLMQGLALPEFAALPSKFGFVVDTGPQRQLAEISGDIRIEAGPAGLILRADGCPTGRLVPDAETAVRLALDLARWFIASGGVGSDGRGRMARHLGLGAILPTDLDGTHSPHAAAAAPVPGVQAGGLCLGAAFGLLPAPALRQLAASGAPVLRMTPWRMIFLPGVTATSVPEGMIQYPADPILRVQACTGSPGCPQANIATRDLARELAASLPPWARLHVSGCAKGCAQPGPADFTLLGGSGGFDLIRNGTAWDPPAHRALSLAQIHEILGG